MSPASGIPYDLEALAPPAAWLQVHLIGQRPDAAAADDVGLVKEVEDLPDYPQEVWVYADQPEVHSPPDQVFSGPGRLDGWEGNKRTMSLTSDQNVMVSKKLNLFLAYSQS